MKEAIAYEREELLDMHVRVIPVMERHAYVRPAPRYTAKEIKALRERASLSQALFAKALSLNAETVRAWEQGKRSPQRCSAPTA